ncbi:HdeD family acid-resistance protein [Terriglobus roseus]|nr:DUF308 domain-containing protein [Terriglobus roseus]
MFGRALSVSSILMIVLGILAIALPSAAGLGVTIVVGWLIALSGIAYLVYAFAAWRIGSFLWRTLLGALDLAVGVYLVAHPSVGLTTLTLWLTLLLCFEGVVEILFFIVGSPLLRSGWILLNGIVTLLLGLMIWENWPSSAAWAIGTLVGVNLIVSGLARLSLATAVRRTVMLADGI